MPLPTSTPPSLGHPEHPLVVVLPYAICPLPLWQPLLAHLATHMHLVLPWDEVKPEYLLSPQGLITLLESLIRHLPPARPFWILGHSLAANVALAWAKTQHHPHLQGVLALAPLNAERPEAVSRAFSLTTRLIGYRSWIRSQVEAKLLSTPTSQDLKDQLAEALKQLPRNTLALALEGLWSGLPAPLFSQFPFMVLCIRGGADPLSIPAALPFHTTHPIEFKTNPLSGHLLPFQATELTSKFILNFLQRHSKH